MPEFYVIFARIMPEFYIIISRKMFPDFFFFWGGGHLPPAPVSYAYGGTPDPQNGHCKPPEQGSGQKNNEIWRSFLFLMHVWGICGVGGGSAPWLRLCNYRTKSKFL